MPPTAPPATDPSGGDPTPPAPATGPRPPVRRRRWTAPLPPDSAYHRLARTERWRWWRPFVGVVVLAVLLLVLTLLAAFAGYAAAAAAGVGWAPGEPPGVLADPLWEAAVLLVGVTVAIPVVLVVAVVVERRPVGSLLSVTGRLRLRWLGWCALVATPVVAAALVGVVLLDDGSDPAPAGWVGAGPMAVALLVIVPLVPLQSAAEEFLARGWLLQAAGSLTRSPWLGIAVGGAVWTALHVPSTGWGAADLLLWSAVIGWLTVRTGGLEAAVALHAVNNLAAFSISAALGQLADDGTIGDAGWQELLVDGLTAPIYAVAVVALHRRLGLTARTPAAG